MSNEPENSLPTTALPVDDLLILPADEPSVAETPTVPEGRPNVAMGGGRLLRNNVVVASARRCRASPG